MPENTNTTPQQSVAAFLKLAELTAISTAHAAGSKKVFSAGRKDLTRLTQIAWGVLQPGEAIPAHQHRDMDEYFFFTGGTGWLELNEQKFPLSEGVFITVPATAVHSLECTGKQLEFFYFGLQVY